VIKIEKFRTHHRSAKEPANPDSFVSSARCARPSMPQSQRAPFLAPSTSLRLSEQLSTETARDFAKLNRQIREPENPARCRKQSPPNRSNRQKIQFRNTGSLNANVPDFPAPPTRKRSQDPPLLPGSAQNVECDVTYSKQTTGKFLPGATTTHGAFTNSHFSVPKIATSLLLTYRAKPASTVAEARRCCRGQQIRISFRRTT
jgi:hypothetical protein